MEEPGLASGIETGDKTEACYPARVHETDGDHYSALGLERRCSLEQIRAAYRLLVKQHHPDFHANSSEATARMQALNAAYEILSDSERKQAYDRELVGRERLTKPTERSRVEQNIAQDVNLRVEDFLQGVLLEVRVNDPANPNGRESYPLDVPPDTAPGTRFRLPRGAPFEGGFVIVRVRVLPGFRFKVRGSDLRVDLRITAQRAAQGGTETMSGASGRVMCVPISPGVERNAIVRIPGEGLPKPRGGRGDLLVRIIYRPDVRISRSAKFSHQKGISALRRP